MSDFQANSRMSKGQAVSKAREYLNGNKNIEGSYLLTATFTSALLSREQAAKSIKVQPNQIGKYTSPRNKMSDKATRALAEAMVAAL